MVRIRLTRVGRIHQPSYRIAVTPQREKRDSKSIELLGHYSPMTKELVINKERAAYWLSVGAQPSDTVKRLFIKDGILKADKKDKKTFSKKAGKQSVERAEQKKAKLEEAKKPKKVEEPAAESVESTEVAAEETAA